MSDDQTAGAALDRAHASANRVLAAADELLSFLAENGMMGGAALIERERARQIEAEGWTAEHDDEHCFGEIAGAAIAYASLARDQAADPSLAEAFTKRPPAQAWRWSHEWWKPSVDPIRNLEKAGALIAAEIDRLLRERREAPGGV